MQRKGLKNFKYLNLLRRGKIQIVSTETDFELILQPEEKKKLLRKYPYFKLKVHLINGKDLLAMDRGGLQSKFKGILF